MKNTLLALTLVLGFSTAVRAHDYPNPVSAQAAKDWVDTGAAVMIDVREQAEVTAGMAQPAEWYAKSSIDADLDAFVTYLGKFSGKEIILYCRSGHRASLVVQALAQRNIMAWNMGGFKDWVDAGFPTKLHAAPF